MKHLHKYYFIALTLVLVSGCVGTKMGAYQVFTEDLNSLTGKPLTQSSLHNLGRLSEAKPFETILLPNGNKRYEYRFQHNDNNGNESCRVFLELEGVDSIIVSASSGGLGCWRVY